MRRGAAIGAVLAVVAIGLGTAACQGGPGPTSSAPSVVEPTTASGSPSPSPTPTLPPDLPWGPTQADWDGALADAQALPVDVAAGQVLMVSITSPAIKPATSLVRTKHLAGVLLLGGAVTSAEQVTGLNNALAVADSGRDWPVMIATDEEGGVVQRLVPALGYVPAFMGAGANGNADEVTAYYGGLGAQMAQLGFTMDVAPDADVTVGLKDPTIRTRSASSDPATAAAAVSAAWRGLDNGGLLPVIKHFPGHGSVSVDSHTALPHQAAAVSDLATRDFVPFSTAIAGGAPAVMMAHIQVAEWGDAPSSVNPLAYSYLRDDMGFTGLIMTDAMNMKAITDTYAPGAATVAALNAGADLVLMPVDVDASIAAIGAAVQDGTLSRDRLDDAAAHVILAARWARHAQDAVEPKRPTEFVEGSIVVSSQSCDALIGSSVKISGGSAGDRAALGAALTKLGVSVGTKGTSITLVTGDAGRADATVVVALGGPWGLSASTAHTYVATWGDGPEQLQALANVLTGAVAPRGTWPVALTLPYPACHP